MNLTRQKHGCDASVAGLPLMILHKKLSRAIFYSFSAIDVGGIQALLSDEIIKQLKDAVIPVMKHDTDASERKPGYCTGKYSSAH
jgi:hypothetical protein